MQSNNITDRALSFIACVGHEKLETTYCVNSGIEYSHDEDFERVVLEQFWKRGSDAPERRRAFRTMYRGFTNTQSRISLAVCRCLLISRSPAMSTRRLPL